MRNGITLVAVLLAPLAGCQTSTALPLPGNDGGQNGGQDGGQNGGRDGAVCLEQIHVPQDLKNKVDLLFVLDNSSGMELKVTELRNRFPSFLTAYENLATNGTYPDLHIGVITTDYGAGATGAPGCSPSPGGQQGRLQAIGAKAPPNCKKPVGANFIQFTYDKNGTGPNNLPLNQNLAETFQCMASVGSSGCGFEHPLEAAYAALRNNLPENQGFIRPDAMLVVVFVTDEDDASAPPDSDVFDKNKAQQYGYESSYARQTRFGVMCCPPGQKSCAQNELQFPPYGDSNGPRACVPAPNLPTGAGPGKLYDVSRYIDLFTLPAARGGVKDDPLDVTLIGIDGPEEPFQVILSNPGTPTGQPYQTCPQLNEASNPPCVPVLQHACQNVQQPEFYGDPAVRLNAVIRSVKSHAIGSICDSNYSAALDGSAKQIVSALGPGCLPEALPKDPMNPARLKFDCTAEDVTTQLDGTQKVVPIPQCPGNGPNNGGNPCWRIEPKGACTQLSPDGVGVTVDRAGKSPPAHTTLRFSCVKDRC